MFQGARSRDQVKDGLRQPAGQQSPGTMGIIQATEGGHRGRRAFDPSLPPAPPPLGLLGRGQPHLLPRHLLVPQGQLQLGHLPHDPQGVKEGGVSLPRVGIQQTGLGGRVQVGGAEVGGAQSGGAKVGGAKVGGRQTKVCLIPHATCR